MHPDIRLLHKLIQQPDQIVQQPRQFFLDTCGQGSTQNCLHQSQRIVHLGRGFLPAVRHTGVKRFPLDQLGDKVRREFGITAFTQLAQRAQQTFAEGSAGGSVVRFDQYAHQCGAAIGDLKEIRSSRKRRSQGRGNNLFVRLRVSQGGDSSHHDILSVLIELTSQRVPTLKGGSTDGGRNAAYREKRPVSRLLRQCHRDFTGYALSRHINIAL